MSEGIKTIWIKFSLDLLGGKGSRNRLRAEMVAKFSFDFYKHKTSHEGWSEMCQVFQSSLFTTCQLILQRRKYKSVFKSPMVLFF